MRTEYDLAKHARKADAVQAGSDGSRNVSLVYEGESAPKLPDVKSFPVLEHVRAHTRL